MNAVFEFEPQKTDSSPSNTPTGSLSRFSKTEWQQMRALANEMCSHGQPVSIIEVHSVSGGATLNLVRHDRVPGSLAGCVWSEWPEALLIERKTKHTVLASRRQRVPASRQLRGYVLIANDVQKSKEVLSPTTVAVHPELLSLEREFWIIANDGPASIDPTGEQYIGYWQPSHELDRQILLHTDLCV